MVCLCSTDCKLQAALAAPSCLIAAHYNCHLPRQLTARAQGSSLEPGHFREVQSCLPRDHYDYHHFLHPFAVKVVSELMLKTGALVLRPVKKQPPTIKSSHPFRCTACIFIPSKIFYDNNLHSFEISYNFSQVVISSQKFWFLLFRFIYRQC